MTTHHAAPAQPQNEKKPERKFEAGKYGLTVLVVLASYLLTIALGALLIFASAYSSQQLLNFLILTTIFFAALAGGITVVYKPAYVPKFPVRPIAVSLTVTGAGMLLLLIWIALRQQDEASQWRVIMIALVLSALGSVLASGLMAWIAKRPRKFNTDMLAMTIAVIGAVLSAILVPTLLRIDDPLLSTKLSVLLLIFGFVLLFVLMVLSTLSTPDTKPNAVPDGYAGVVSVKGRITRVTFDKSIDVKLEGEDFKKVDVRLRPTSVTAHNCLTADHVPTDVHATVEWRPHDTEEDVRAFHMKSSDPEGAIRALARSAIVTEVGLRDSLHIAGREDQIAAGVKRRISAEARQYGILIKNIAVTHALLKYPTPAQSVSPLTEVSRLNLMDPAVRKASKTTVKHAEVLSKAEATALAGKEGREAEEHDEDAGKSRKNQ